MGGGLMPFRSFSIHLTHNTMKRIEFIRRVYKLVSYDRLESFKLQVRKSQSKGFCLEQSVFQALVTMKINYTYYGD